MYGHQKVKDIQLCSHLYRTKDNLHVKYWLRPTFWSNASHSACRYMACIKMHIFPVYIVYYFNQFTLNTEIRTHFTFVRHRTPTPQQWQKFSYMYTAISTTNITQQKDYIYSEHCSLHKKLKTFYYFHSHIHDADNYK